MNQSKITDYMEGESHSETDLNWDERIKAEIAEACKPYLYPEDIGAIRIAFGDAEAALNYAVCVLQDYGLNPQEILAGVGTVEKPR